MNKILITLFLTTTCASFNVAQVAVGGCTGNATITGCTDECALNYNPQAVQDDGSCDFEPEPQIECWETTSFNNTTCMWEVTGTQPSEPTDLECYEMVVFNDSTCDWEVTGEMPVEPEVNCDQTASFDETLCAWSVGTFPPVTDDNCEFTDDSYDPNTCEVFNVSNCPEGTFLNTVDCLCETVVVDGCTDPCATNYNPDANSDDGSCVLPTEPPIECWESSSFNTTTCLWEVSGTQPTEPTTECYETATFNNTTCVWDVTGEQPVEPIVECYQSTTFNTTSCQWDVTGSQPSEPNTECYETATFSDDLCNWVVSGTQPEEPTVECYESTSFNDITCVWEVSGTMPEQPAIDCWETTVFNDVSCEWDVTGEQDPEPPTECYENAVFNLTSCSWDVIGEPVDIFVLVSETQVCVRVTESPTIATLPVFQVSPTLTPISTDDFQVCYNPDDFVGDVEYTFTVTYGDCVFTETYTVPCVDCTDTSVAVEIQTNLNYEPTTNELCLVDSEGNPYQGYVTNDDKISTYTLDEFGCVTVLLDNNGSVDFYPTPVNGCVQCVYCITP